MLVDTKFQSSYFLLTGAKPTMNAGGVLDEFSQVPGTIRRTEGGTVLASLPDLPNGAALTKIDHIFNTKNTATHRGNPMPCGKVN